MAQLQSCQKTIREVALSGQGYSADIEVSFPTIVIAISNTIKEEMGREVNLEEMRQMVKNKKKWREDTAKGNEDRYWESEEGSECNAIRYGA